MAARGLSDGLLEARAANPFLVHDVRGGLVGRGGEPHGRVVQALRMQGSRRLVPWEQVNGEPIDDEELLLAAREGDRDALEMLLQRHQGQILRFGQKMCRHEEDAREVLQETLLSAAGHLPEFRGESSFSSWLYTIARHACSKLRRKRVGEPARFEPLTGPAGVATTVPAPQRPPDGQVASREIAQALQQAIANLDPKYREVLVLRDVEGFSAKEVADITGLSVPATKSRLHRARSNLRTRLEPWLRPEEAGEAGPEACPDVVRAMSESLEGELDPGACRRLEQHVQGCPRCKARCDGLQQVLSLCAASPTPQVPTDLQAAIRRELRGLVRV